LAGPWLPGLCFYSSAIICCGVVILTIWALSCMHKGSLSRLGVQWTVLRVYTGWQKAAESRYINETQAILVRYLWNHDKIIWHLSVVGSKAFQSCIQPSWFCRNQSNSFLILSANLNRLHRFARINEFTQICVELTLAPN